MQPTIKALLTNLISSSVCTTFAHKLFGFGIPVFMLHRMRNNKDHDQPQSATSDIHLRNCLTYLTKKHYTFLSIRELFLAITNRHPLPEKCVVFTMDDGFEDQARIAAPIFHEFNCPATIFLITGMLDGKLWPWDDKVAYLFSETVVPAIELTIGETKFNFSLTNNEAKKSARRKIQSAIKAMPFNQLETILATLESVTQVKLPESAPAQYKPMTWEQARNFEKLGVEFAPHTVSHPILSKVSEDIMQREILDSWNRICSELTNPCPVFCYPTGRYSDFGTREIKFIQEAGFIGATSTIPAQVRPERANSYYLYSLPRYQLPSSFSDFKLYCSWIEYIRESNLHFWPR